MAGLIVEGYDFDDDKIEGKPGASACSVTYYIPEIVFWIEDMDLRNNRA